MRTSAFLRASAFVWGVTVLAALMTAATPGTGAAVREAYAFRFDSPRGGSWSEAAGYLAANLRVVGAILIAAWARPRSGRFGPVLDVIVALTFVVNACAVGSAVGAYGPPMLRRLLHVPFEWGALSIVLAAYLPDPRGAIEAEGVARAAAAAGALLSVAAWTEGFATP